MYGASREVVTFKKPDQKVSRKLNEDVPGIIDLPRSNDSLSENQPATEGSLLFKRGLLNGLK